LFLTGTRNELVATFLALLELIRRKLIVVRQPVLFGPIRVELRERNAAVTLISEG
jgi:chromatin segregation and condensation protein Rec8/ScpA/Scc1 (kleisin family)